MLWEGCGDSDSAIFTNVPPFARSLAAHKVTLEELRAEAAKPKSPLAGMLLLQRGSRLSVQPVAPAEWAHIMGMVEAKKKESKK